MVNAARSPLGAIASFGVAWVAHEAIVEVARDCPECGVALQLASAVIA